MQQEGTDGAPPAPAAHQRLVDTRISFGFAMATLSKLPIKTLIAIAGLAGVFMGSAALYIQRKADLHFNQHPLVTRSKDLLLRNVKAVELIGPPIKFPGQVAFHVEIDQQTKGKIMNMEIPFWGNKLEGHLQVIAIVDPLIDNWDLHTLKAHITTVSKMDKPLPCKTFLIYQVN